MSFKADKKNRENPQVKVEEVQNSSGPIFWVERLFFLLVLLFSVCCIKLCAQDSQAVLQKAKQTRESFVAETKKYIGCPYEYGAVGPDTFDCSGLIYYVARESVKVQLPRTAKAIYNYCKIVDDSEKEVGDLLFFKTTSSGNISHVGIYIGNSQFISAISDGPNTGVIVSSLKQDYWKGKYVCAGQFLRSAKSKAEKKADEEEGTARAAENSTTRTAAKPAGKKSTQNEASIAKASGETSKSSQKTGFADSLVLDATLTGGWSFFDENGFGFNFRGIDGTVNATYKNLVLNPGIGVIFRGNIKNQIFQLPVVISATLNDYVRIYAGPVFSFANGKLCDGRKEIKPSIFPGIAGVAFTTPAISAGKVKIQFVQDVNFSVFNKMDGSALKPNETFGNGLGFYSGVKVSLPLANII